MPTRSNASEDTPQDRAIDRQILRDRLDLSDPRSPTLSPIRTIHYSPKPKQSFLRRLLDRLFTLIRK